MERLNNYSSYIKKKHGERVQKISIDAGFTCPNRDGLKGIGGCTFCNNDSFSPGDRKKSIEEQINTGIIHYKRRFPKLSKFVVYFQSYTNTYADLNSLKNLYEQALKVPGVIGLSIGTRPDCLDRAKFEYLEELAQKFEVTVEIGVESCNDQTLFEINRGHDLKSFLEAIELGKNRNILLATHLIMGLPQESKEEMLQSIKTLSKLPLDFIKFHQLHIVKNTVMAHQYLKTPFHLLSKEEYFEILGEGITYLNPNIVIQRMFGDAPESLMVVPAWDGNSSLWTQEFHQYLEENNLWQGKNYVPE
jgi:radical SAM protein (TIGR01212 family)